MRHKRDFAPLIQGCPQLAIVPIKIALQWPAVQPNLQVEVAPWETQSKKPMGWGKSRRLLLPSINRVFGAWHQQNAPLPGQSSSPAVKEIAADKIQSFFWKLGGPVRLEA